MSAYSALYNALSTANRVIATPVAKGIGAVFSWAAGSGCLKKRGLSRTNDQIMNDVMCGVVSATVCTLPAAVLMVKHTASFPVYMAVGLTVMALAGFAPARIRSALMAGKHDALKEKEQQAQTPPNP